MRKGTLAILVCSMMVGGCSTGGREAVYLSLSDRSMVVGSTRDGWSGPHQVSLGDGPGNQAAVLRREGGPIPHAVVAGADGVIWVKVGEDGGGWLRCDGEGGRILREVVRRRGGVEVFGESLREVLGLGGLGA